MKSKYTQSLKIIRLSKNVGQQIDIIEKEIMSNFYLWAKNEMLMTLCGIFKYKVNISAKNMYGNFIRFTVSINDDEKFYFETDNKRLIDFKLICFYLAIEEYIKLMGVPDEYLDFNSYVFKRKLTMKFYRKIGLNKDIKLLLDTSFFRNKVKYYTENFNYGE